MSNGQLTPHEKMNAISVVVSEMMKDLPREPFSTRCLLSVAGVVGSAVVYELARIADALERTRGAG